MKKKLIFMVLIVCFLLGTFIGFSKSDKDQITIVSGGDLLISQSILKASVKGNDNYDFDDIFKEIKGYIQDADCAVLNLETSIGGDIVEYQGFPRFNTPEVVLDASKKAGFDLFLTASNHSYDLGYPGLITKLDELEKRDMQYVGTRKDSKDQLHKVIDVHGFKIGILNYTKESSDSSEDNIVLNMIRGDKPGTYSDIIRVDDKGKDLIARFNYSKLDDFYEVLEQDIEFLKEKGAEIIVAYPHWGSEYLIEASDENKQIAQKMCDLGVDVIIGGHPHVVQPTEVLESSISGKKTICIYSMGNFVSSMHRYQDKPNAEYVEDGALFSFTVKRNSSGQAEVVSSDVLPLWVERKDEKFVVIPLDPENKVDGWNKNHENSYNRTMGLVAKGLDEFNK